MEITREWESLLSELAEKFRALEKENQELKNENQQMQLRFDRMRFQQAFSALLKADHTREELTELCNRVGIRNPDSHFVIMEFFNDEILGREDRVPLDPFTDPDVSSLQNLITEAFDGGQPVTAPQGDRILCILCMPEEMSWDNGRTWIMERTHAINDRLQTFRLYTAVSQPVPGAALLPAAARVVRQVADYMTVMEEYTQELLFATDLELQALHSDPVPIVPPEQRQFIFLLRIGSFLEAVEPAHAIIRIKLLSNPSVYMLPLAMASMKDTLLHSIGSACIELDLHEAYDQLEVVKRLTGAATVQALQSELDFILEGLQKAFTESKQETTLPYRIQSYIDENFRDPDLNVNAVAEYFEITSSQATKAFRSLHPDGILSYIHERRLFAAKEQLGSGQSISEIARSTGYRTSANMIRAFKKSEGITPGKLAVQDRQELQNAK